MSVPDAPYAYSILARFPQSDNVHAPTAAKKGKRQYNDPGRSPGALMGFGRTGCNTKTGKRPSLFQSVKISSGISGRIVGFANVFYNISQKDRFLFSPFVLE